MGAMDAPAAAEPMIAGRHAKRASAVACTKMADLYECSGGLAPGERIGRPLTPDPWDRSISKREWEKSLCKWRSEMRKLGMRRLQERAGAASFGGLTPGEAGLGAGGVADASGGAKAATKAKAKDSGNGKGKSKGKDKAQQPQGGVSGGTQAFACGGLPPAARG